MEPKALTNTKIRIEQHKQTPKHILNTHQTQ